MYKAWHPQPVAGTEVAQSMGGPHSEGEIDMAGKTQELKGRVKEAAGILTDNPRLKREGKLDQTVGKVKQATGEMIKKVKAATK
jgi:uncharacterized protein YjbJ (UPF0337 family)